MKRKYESKNDWLFLDNHRDKNVYCPFCGEGLNDNIFTDGGYRDSMNSGAMCKNCGIVVYTYKVESIE